MKAATAVVHVIHGQANKKPRHVLQQRREDVPARRHALWRRQGAVA